MALVMATSLKTDPSLLAKVRHAAERKLTTSELVEQRVSFVYGSMGGDMSGMTKDHVRQVILEQGGAPHQRHVPHK